jgi:hypothetical protein
LLCGLEEYFLNTPFEEFCESDMAISCLEYLRAPRLKCHHYSEKSVWLHDSFIFSSNVVNKT